MSSFIIKYQTSDLVPPPFAHAVQISGRTVEGQITEYEFELSYLGREDLTQEEILEEGFSGEDDFSVKGKLPQAWTDYWNELIKATDKTYPEEISEAEDFWQIESEGAPFYPSKPEKWKFFMEEFQQAVFEEQEWEAPLRIILVNTGEAEQETLEINASFLLRKIEITLEKADGRQVKNLKWQELNPLLKKVYGGEYLDERAEKQKPAYAGIFVNFGDSLWYEAGKSLHIQKKKLLSLFEF